MKPEDILFSIGDVEDRYIRKARRKSLMTALVVFLLIATILCTFFVRTMPNDQLLIRYNPDGSVNTGYLAPEEFAKSKWTSMEHTTYKDGEAVSTAKFTRKLFGDYSIITDSKTLVGTVKNPYEISDYVSSIDFRNEYLRTMFTMDILDRPQWITIVSEYAYGATDQVLSTVEVQYFEAGNTVSQQTLYSPESQGTEISGYKVFGYKDGQVGSSIEFDVNDVMLAYSETAFDGSTTTERRYLADGTMTGYTISHYDMFNRLAHKEHFDSSDNLIGAEQYHYRTWELFFSLKGFLVLFFFIIPFSATFAVAIWSDRIKPGAILVAKEHFGDESETSQLLRETRNLRNEIEQLSQVSKDQLSDETAIALTKEISQLNETLSKLLDKK